MTETSAVAVAEKVLAEVTGDDESPEVGEPKFTLELNQDQKDIREWVHGFAEKVVRPAAEEWDEREETPWPVIQEAAKIGLYGFEALAQFWADETGLTLPIANEELFWGDAGIGMAIMGTSLAVAAIFGQGTPEQQKHEGAQDFLEASNTGGVWVKGHRLMGSITARTVGLHVNRRLSTLRGGTRRGPAPAVSGSAGSRGTVNRAVHPFQH